MDIGSVRFDDWGKHLRGGSWVARQNENLSLKTFQPEGCKEQKWSTPDTQAITTQPVRRIDCSKRVAWSNERVWSKKCEPRSPRLHRKVARSALEFIAGFAAVGAR